MEKYIHYGHKKFEQNLFLPIRNRIGFIKPEGGLWASNINANFGWEDFYEKEYGGQCDKDNSFMFCLSDNARVLQINSSCELDSLPIIKNRSGVFNGWMYLDFEKIVKKYDAMEVLISKDKQLYYDLYGWDCDSILVMNSDVINMIC